MDAAGLTPPVAERFLARTEYIGIHVVADDGGLRRRGAKSQRPQTSCHARPLPAILEHAAARVGRDDYPDNGQFFPAELADLAGRVRHGRLQRIC